jgi:hypothetical protein
VFFSCRYIRAFCFDVSRPEPKTAFSDNIVNIEGARHMADIKEQIAASVRQIDDLNRELAEHWSKIQKYVTEKRVDEAISLLNAYFRMRTKLQQAESSLESVLKSQFSDR